jgi:hypothetical protein
MCGKNRHAVTYGVATKRGGRFLSDTMRLLCFPNACKLFFLFTFAEAFKEGYFFHDITGDLSLSGFPHVPGWLPDT